MTNREQNRQFEEAVRQIENVVGRKLDAADRRRLHDEITGHGYAMQEIIRYRLSYVCQIGMKLKGQVEDAFEPLIGQGTWGSSLGYGSFITIEFGPKRLFNRHYHGEWHLWLYLCEWRLTSGGRVLAHSESKRHIMQVAIDNINGEQLSG
ncbi:MAG: hypothetical protein ACRD2S_09430, partial [Terriglobales bacterium]